jgi:hypothetical protein
MCPASDFLTYMLCIDSHVYGPSRVLQPAPDQVRRGDFGRRQPPADDKARERVVTRRERLIWMF